jgi:dihydroorotate dehydrogenase electron transfer subunit
MTETIETRIECSVGARVVGCTPLCREHICIEIMLPSFAESAPGQFLQLLCRDSNNVSSTVHDWPTDGFPSVSSADFAGQRPYLRRPFSIADRWTGSEGSVRLAVISRAVGLGTQWLARLQAGDTLNVTGPLGRGFRLPPLDTPIVMIGGGVGIPPLLYLARRLWERGWQDVTAIFGATTGDLLPLRLSAEPASDGAPTRCVALPAEAPFSAIVTTDDGTVGLPGRVTDGLKAWYARRAPADRPALVCACGPERMLKAVAQLTRELGLPGQLCVERNMGCGVGTCLSCVVRRRDAQRPEGWSWALACTDGPVFERDELLDYCGQSSA